MGVAISQLIPRREIGLADLAGQTIALDAFNTIYFFLAIVRDRMTGETLKDHKGHVTSHLSGLLYRTSKFLEVGIKPIYVFNGKYPQFKQRTVEKRRALREEAKRKWKEAVRTGQPALRYAQAATKMDVSIVETAKELLDLMGVPWVQAPSEGEAQCSWMCQQGFVFATASQDLDSLLFGSTRLVRNLSAIGEKEHLAQEVAAEVDPELIELGETLKSLGLTREQLVLLGLLVGTDYNEGVKGVGLMMALSLVRKHETLENILARCKFPGSTDIKKVYEFFLNPPHTDSFRMDWKPPQAEKLERFLVNEHDFSRERVDRTVQKLQAVFAKIGMQ